MELTAAALGLSTPNKTKKNKNKKILDREESGYLTRSPARRSSATWVLNLMTSTPKNCDMLVILYHYTFMKLASNVSFTDLMCSINK